MGTAVLVSELRYAARSLTRAPLLSAVVICSLAAGIGINTVVFSWVQARFLEPIPGVRDSRSIQLVEPRSGNGLYVGSSWPEYLDLRERLRTPRVVFASRTAPFYVGEPGSVERVFGVLVSDSYFDALELRPVVGRLLVREDFAGSTAGEVAVISHRIWQSRFDASPAVLSRTLRINGREFAIVGVTPPEFQGTTLGLQFDVWIPATLAPAVSPGSRELDERSTRGYSVMVRLDPRARAATEAELASAMRELARAHPDTNAGTSAELLPLHNAPRGPQRMMNAALLVLQGLMLLLLVAVCGNVATLMLARASGRAEEMAIRMALGAAGARIAAIVLLENLLLALAGAALGVVVATWATQALLILPMVGLPVRFQTSVDGTGLGFAAALGLIAGLVSGSAPALHLVRSSTQRMLRSTASRGRSRLRSGLMAVQVALALVVLVIAGMFFGAVVETRTTDPGFERRRVMLAAYDLSGRRVSAEFSRELTHRILDRVHALPFVESAAVAASVPLDIHGMSTRTFTVAGRPRDEARQDEALVNTVTRGYFAVMGIPIVRGEDLTGVLTPGQARQVVVNEAFASRYIGEGEAIGREIRTRNNIAYRIVGIARNSLYNVFGEPPTPIVHFSYADLPQPRGEIHVRLRTGAPADASAELARVVREVDPDLPVFNFRTMDQHVDTNLLFRRIPARMFAVLGPMLLVLAALGIYAVVSYAVSLRTREIAVRLALGATHERVVRDFVVEHMATAVAGAFVGWCVVFAAASAFAPRERMEPLIFLLVPAILLSVAALACWIPAQRASRVGPARALRN